jgi:hypothetical protein
MISAATGKRQIDHSFKKMVIAADLRPEIWKNDSNLAKITVQYQVL